MPNDNKMMIFNESTKDKDATAPHFEESCRQFKKMYDDTQTDSAVANAHATDTEVDD